jgi:hypothetical protein
VVHDIESGGDVTVVAYPVWYAAGRRFADIVIRDLADQSYTPMIALSLARYQPFSLANLGLSRLVRTDYLPLLPTRVLTVNRKETGAVVVELAGVGPAAPNRVDIRLEARDGPVLSAGEDVAGELRRQPARQALPTDDPLVQQLSSRTVFADVVSL